MFIVWSVPVVVCSQLQAHRPICNPATVPAHLRLFEVYEIVDALVLGGS